MMPDAGGETSPEVRRIESILIEREKRWTALITEGDVRARERIAALDSRITERFTSLDRAVSKAETANERRFESINEFRAQLADQAATFMPKNEADVRLKAISEQLTKIQTQVDNFLGQRSGVVDARSWAVAAVGLVATIIAIATAVLR